VKILIHLMALLSLSLLIWFVGPLIAIAGYVPLASLSSRVVSIIVLIGCWLLFSGLRARQRSKANRQLLEGISGAGGIEQSGGVLDNELDTLQRGFDEALQLLKQSTAARKNKQFLYTLPWYIIIGPPGSGKTTLLVNSGLQFPLADRYGDKGIKGVGGTRNCDWWFANDAVLIDTAGRYTTQDSQQQVDKGAWLGFLALLKKNRPRRPVNGALIALSLADFMILPEAELKAHAQAIKQRIQELNAQLGIDVPVYMLFTKCDRVAGFNEFFDDLDAEARTQVWGETFPADAPNHAVIERFAGAYQGLIERLDARLLARLQDEGDLSNRSLIFGFPRQMEALRGPIIDFLKDIFSVNRYQEAFFLRGVYFTSGTQEGSPIDQVMGALAQSFGLDRQQAPLFSGQGRSYFITRLLRDVIFKEAELAGLDQKKEKRRRLLQQGLYGTCVLSVLAFSTGWFISFQNNKEKIKNLENFVNQYDSEVKQARWQLDFSQLLPRMEALRAARDRVYTPDDGWLLKLGLYQGDDMAPAIQAAYERFLKHYFLEAIRYRFEERLQDAIAGNHEILYELLKAYLMLNNLEKRDMDVLKAWISIDWEMDYANQPETLNGLVKHLDYLLTLPSEPVKLNAGLIASARRILTQVPQAYQIYSRIKSETAENSYHFNVRAAMGKYADRVFINIQGELDQLSIPGLYTREGYRKLFLQQGGKILKQAVEQDWVLNRMRADAASVTELRTLQREINDLYVADYIRYWANILANVQIRATASAEETIELLGYISGKGSPLKQFLETVTENTALAQASQPAAQALAAVGNTKMQAALQLVKKQAGTDFVANVQAIDEHFSELHEFTRSRAQQGSDLDRLLVQLAEIYTAMIEVQGGAGLLAGGRVNGGLNNTALAVKLRRLQLEGTRLPEPLKDWVGVITKKVGGEMSRNVKTQLDKQWRDVVLQCKEALEGRYPFAKGSRRDVNLMDFGRFFSKSGIIERFFQQNLKPYVETGVRSWRLTDAAAQTLAVSNRSIRQFQYAAIIRDKYFKLQGEMPVIRFSVKPLSKTDDIASIRLQIDGQSLEYRGGSAMGKEFRWPGRDAGGYVKVDFEFADGSRKTAYQVDGPWALFRLLDITAEGAIGERSDRFTIKLSHALSYARFEIHTGGGINPFNTAQMRNFHCPRRL